MVNKERCIGPSGVRALLAESEEATIVGIFLFLLFSFLLLGVPLFKTPEGVVVGFQIFAWAPN